MVVKLAQDEIDYVFLDNSNNHASSDEDIELIRSTIFINYKSEITQNLLQPNEPKLIVI